MIQRSDNESQLGFTIVELLIATAILSLIILLSTVMISSIGSLFYKGIIQTRTQNNTRNISDDVAQHLKFSNGDLWSSSHVYAGVTINSYCVNGTRYSYVIGRQIGTIAHVLWRDNPGASCTPVDLTLATPINADGSASINGAEMIAPSSRLTVFSLTRATLTSPIAINVGVAFGDPSLTNAVSGSSVKCLGAAGDSFCASVYQSTIVTQRAQ